MRTDVHQGLHPVQLMPDKFKCLSMPKLLELIWSKSNPKWQICSNLPIFNFEVKNLQCIAVCVCFYLTLHNFRWPEVDRHGTGTGRNPTHQSCTAQQYVDCSCFLCFVFSLGGGQQPAIEYVLIIVGWLELFVLADAAHLRAGKLNIVVWPLQSGVWG